MDAIRMSDNQPSDKALTPLYTAAEVADYLRITTCTVYRMVDDGRLACIRIGQGLRFTPEHINDFVCSRSDEAR